MAKPKLSISDLQIESCVTTLSGKQLDQVKGGAAFVQGRRYTYSIRWTAVDTRVQTEGTTQLAPPTPDRK